MNTNPRRDQGQEHVERAKDAAGSMADRAKDAASGVADKARETGTAVLERARDVASQVGEKAGSVASNIGQRAEGAVGSLGGGMQSLGETVREKAPESGFLGKASEGVACALEHGGKYLQEKNLSGMADDMTNLIRRNPIPALLVGVGLGFLLARTLRS